MFRNFVIGNYWKAHIKTFGANLLAPFSSCNLAPVLVQKNFHAQGIPKQNVTLTIWLIFRYYHNK